MPPVPKTNVSAKPAPTRRAPVATKPVVEDGTDDTVGNQLEELEASWQQAEPQSGNDRVDEGKYQVKINDFTIGPSKSAGRMQVTFELTILNGKFANRKLWKRDGIDNPESMGWFMGSLAKLGIEAPKSIKQLPEVCQSLVDTCVEVNVKHKDDYTNVYFNRALDDSEVSEEAPAEQEEDAVGEVEQPAQWAVGETCQAEFDDGWYSGEIISIEGENATVRFEDGAEVELSLESLHVVDLGEVEAAATEEEGEAPAEEEAEAGGLSLTFSDDDLDVKARERVDTAARAAGYNPDDYETWVGLMADMAEKMGMTGEQGDPNVVMATIAPPQPKPAPSAKPVSLPKAPAKPSTPAAVAATPKAPTRPQPAAAKTASASKPPFKPAAAPTPKPAPKMGKPVAKK